MRYPPLRNFLLNYGLPLLKPLSIPVLVWGAISLILIGYFGFMSLTWTGVRYHVIYRGSYLEIAGPSQEPAEIFKELQPGDRITALDDLPVDQFIAAQPGSIQLYPVQEGVAELSSAGEKLALPPVQGEKSLLWGVAVSSITFDFSHRAGPPPQILTGNSVVNATSVKVVMAAYPENTRRLVFVLVLLLVAAAVWNMGLYFYVLKPLPVTAVFSLLNTTIALELLVSIIDRSFLDQVARFALACTNAFIGIFLLHFMLLFPDGVAPGKWWRRGLVAGYLIIFALVVVRLGTIFAPVQPPLYKLELTVKRFNYLAILVPTILALGRLGAVYRRSQGQERHRIRVPVMASALAAFLPLAALVYYLVGSLWGAVIYEQFGLFFLPCLIMPPAFGYAVIKNDFLGVSLRLRRLVVHGLLSVLIISGYLALTALLGLFLPFSRELGQDPLLTALAVTALTVTLYMLRARAQSVVDRFFRVDPLDYGKLNTTWSERLVRATGMNGLMQTVVAGLPRDFHYRSAGVIIWHPQVIKLATLVPDHGTKGLLFYQNEKGELEVRTLREAINPEFLASLELNRVTTLERAPDKLGLSPLELLQPAYLYALKLGDESYGALVLGEKYTQYLPAREELEHLKLLAGQIAVACYNSVLISTEKALRELFEEELNLEEQTREDERLKISGLLHDDILQELYSHQFMIGSLSQECEPDKFEATQNLCLEAVDRIGNKLRDINQWLVPAGVNTDLVEVLGGIYRLHQDKYPEITFSFKFEGDRVLLRKLLSVSQKLTVYRLVEEATNNAIRHAKAQNIQAGLRLIENGLLPGPFRLEVEIQDDGVGLEKSLAQKPGGKLPPKHFGLSTMRRRIEVLKGTFDLASPPEHGLKILAILPVAAENTNKIQEFEDLLSFKWFA